jgi:hypothetical protein
MRRFTASAEATTISVGASSDISCSAANCEAPAMTPTEKPITCAKVQPRLGPDDAEEDREGHHDDVKGSGVARTAPECLSRADRIAHREGPFTASEARVRPGCGGMQINCGHRGDQHR